MPVFGVVPIMTIEYWIQANTLDRCTALPSQLNLFRDFNNPLAPSDADVTGFCNQERTVVTLEYHLEQTMIGYPSLIARIDVPVKPLPAGAFPLIAVIEVAAENIEVPWMSSQFGLLAAGDHVPCFKLGFRL